MRLSLFLGVWLIGYLPTTHAASELISPATPTRNQTVISALCVSDPAEVAKIETKIAANAKTDFKYDGYREALKSDSPTELFARLVYAETLAANCPSLENSQVSSVIAGVIGNRVRIRSGNVSSVVFQRDQFASSLNIYKEARNHDFLCPSNPKLWDIAFKLAAAELGSGPHLVTSKDTVHYFLRKHSPRWPKETWDYKEDVSAANDETRACVPAFHNSKWR